MDRQHAHQMLDQLGPGQLDAVVRLLEVLTDPENVPIRNAPIDDEPVTEEDRRRFHPRAGLVRRAGR